MPALAEHKKLSPMQAIKAKCLDCNYDPQDVGNALSQIENCICSDCSLWQHRPLTGKTKRLQREKALLLLTPDQRELLEIRRETSRENMVNLRAKVIAKALN